MPPLILSDKAHITQGDLPHWDDKKAIYFATFRLADSLPITAMKEFKAWEEDKLESLNHGNVATTAWEEFERERQDLIEKLSDKGHGACILQRPKSRVGIVKLGLDAPTWQYNDKRGARFVFACQGIEPCQANADAGTRLLKKVPM